MLLFLLKRIIAVIGFWCFHELWFNKNLPRNLKNYHVSLQVDSNPGTIPMPLSYKYSFVPITSSHKYSPRHVRYCSTCCCHFWKFLAKKFFLHFRKLNLPHSEFINENITTFTKLWSSFSASLLLYQDQYCNNSNLPHRHPSGTSGWVQKVWT